MDYTVFLWIAIIILATKILGLGCRKINLPEVVGFLVAGVLLGPSGFNIITLTGDNGTFLKDASELGVIFLMFSAGLTTEIDEMKKNIVASTVTAVIGVVLPLIGGLLTFALYFHMDMSDHTQMLEALFMGVVLTATSVSITVQTLRELGKLGGKVGTTILGAAVIDDILGIIVLTIVSSMKDTSISVGVIFGKIILYFVVIAIIAFLMIRFHAIVDNADHKRRAGLYAIAFALLLAYASEEFFGIADITGAFFAGLILSISKTADYIDQKVEGITNMFFGCIFFACIGIKVSLGGMDAKAWGFAIILTIVAILTKVVGCGLGAKACKLNIKESLQVGVGMISRGEVALIVADKGRAYGLVSDEMFAPVVLMVIITTLVTPIFLKMVFKKDTDGAVAEA